MSAPANPTAQNYAELQRAYDHFNQALFDGAALIEPTIRAYGIILYTALVYLPIKKPALLLAPVCTFNYT